MISSQKTCKKITTQKQYTYKYMSINTYYNIELGDESDRSAKR